MLKNITIGQYFPGNSVIHRLDPRIKIILTMAYIIMLFVVDNIWAIALSFVFSLIVYMISKVPISMAFKGVKAILPIVIFTAIINMFFVTGDPIFERWIITITKQGIEAAVLMTSRIICLIIGSSILTYTTSPIALTDAIERLFTPLKYLKMPVHEVAMMMTIALRFIPTLIEETDKIMSAQKARGADMESGNLIQRAKALLPILIPLFVSAFRRADDLALAMESRGYHGGEGRTRMKQIHMGILDIFACLFMVVFIVAVLYTRNLPNIF